LPVPPPEKGQAQPIVVAPQSSSISAPVRDVFEAQMALAGGQFRRAPLTPPSASQTRAAICGVFSAWKS